MLEKIRSYGMTLTYVNGRMVDADAEDAGGATQHGYPGATTGSLRNYLPCATRSPGNVHPHLHPVSTHTHFRFIDSTSGFLDPISGFIGVYFRSIFSLSGTYFRFPHIHFRILDPISGFIGVFFRSIFRFSVTYFRFSAYISGRKPEVAVSTFISKIVKIIFKWNIFMGLWRDFRSEPTGSS